MLAHGVTGGKFANGARTAAMAHLLNGERSAIRERLAQKVGDTVTRGQTIGNSDSSGRIHGPHLHFVTRQNGTRVNPCTVVTCP